MYAFVHYFHSFIISVEVTFHPAFVCQQLYLKIIDHVFTKILQPT